MYKNVAFAQGLAVFVPKQQLLISELLKLTVGDTMQARQRVKKKLKLTRILKAKGNRKILIEF